MTSSMNSLKVILGLFIFQKLLLKVLAECPSNMTTINGSLFILSRDQVDANDARESCSLLGGNLGLVGNEEIRIPLIKLMNEEYNIEDLQNVWMFYKRSTRSGNEYKFYKYAESSDEVNAWRYAGLQFKLYKRPIKTYTVPVTFCEFTYKWLVVLNQTASEACRQGWRYDFDLYGGSQHSPGTKELYYYSNVEYSSKLTPSPGISEGYDIAVDSVLIPDISVYIGARSDVNQTDWFWNDQTMVNDSSFPLSNKDICQQMTFHYNDTDWNLSAQNCTGKPAYYACQIQLRVNVEPVQCNGTLLNVTWDPRMFNGILSTSTELRIDLIGTVYTTKLSKGYVIIEDLKARTTYSLTVTVLRSDRCSPVNLSTNVIGKTGYGFPDTIDFAYVRNDRSTQDCFIHWSRDHSDNDMLKYRIKATSNLTSFTIHVNQSVLEVQSENEVYVKVDVDDHGYNTIVEFTIEAYTCWSWSRPKHVLGSCITPPPTMNQPPTSPPPHSNLILIVTPVGAVILIIIIIIFAVLFHKRKVLHESQINFQVTNSAPLSENVQVGQSISTKNNEPKNERNRSENLQETVYMNEINEDQLTNNVYEEVNTKPHSQCAVVTSVGVSSR